MPKDRDLPPWIHDRRRRLGIRIRTLRHDADLTQERFAELTGIDRRTVQRIEAGTSELPYGNLLLISHALDVPLVELVG